MIPCFWRKTILRRNLFARSTKPGRSRVLARCYPRLEWLENRLTPATHTWTGVSSALWSDPANWQEGMAPSAGEMDVALVFPDAAARLANQNDLDNLRVQTLTFAGAGYTVSGKPLTLAGAIEHDATGPNTISLDMTLADGDRIVRRQTDGLTLSGTLSGPGGLNLAGPGSSTLAGSSANSYAGMTTLDLHAGAVFLNKTGGVAIPGKLSDGSDGVVLLADEQLSDTARPVFALGLGLDLNGHTETVGGITLIASKVVDSSTGHTGLLRLNGNAAGSGYVTNVSTISADISLGNAPRRFSGGGIKDSFVLSGSISADAPDVGLTVDSGGTVVFSGSAANTYTGATTLTGGTLRLAKEAGKHAVPGSLLVNATGLPTFVTLAVDDQIADDAAVAMIGFTGTLDLAGHSDAIGSLSLQDGQVTTGGGTLTLNGDVTGASPHAVAGSLSLGGATRTFSVPATQTLAITASIQSGGLTKMDAGTLVLAADNSYTGKTTVMEGVLEVNGAQPGSSVQVHSRLQGVGRVGSVAAGSGSVIAPMLNAAGFTTGDARFESGSIYCVHLNGTNPGTEYGQLHVVGDLTLNDSSLDVAVGFQPALGDTFVIMENDGTDPVSGTFAGLPEGAVFPVNGIALTISYHGGTGNDVVLTRQQTATTTVVTSAVNLAMVGPATTFMAKVQANTPLSGPPQGTVTFVDGANTLGPVSLDAGGYAVLAVSSLALTTGQVVATYSGSTEYNPSTSAPWTESAYQLTLTKCFVTQVYTDLLGRAADDSATTYWGTLLDQGQLTRAQVVQQIQASPEYRTRLVGQLYGQLLHRPADSASLDYWLGFLGQGATAEAMAAQVLGSEEYYVQRSGGTNDGFVPQVYQDVLGRTPSSSELQGWSQSLASGTTRVVVAGQILSSSESDAACVQTAFVQLLRRTPDASERSYFTSTLQQGVSGDQLIAQLAGSLEYFGALTHGVSQTFVTHVYEDLLRRDADAGGLAFWVAQLTHAVANPLQVVQGIQDTTEYRSILVHGQYNVYLHRPADPDGLSYFVGLLQGGATLEDVQAALASSAEYFQTQAGGTNDGFLEALYQDALHRPIDAAARADFSQALADGVSRQTIADLVFASDEYRGVLVSSSYQEYLGRPADSDGLDYWVAALRQGVRDERMFAGLISSDEYFAKG